MLAVQHLARAPIVEALIDFRVRPRKDLDLTTFSSAFAPLSSRYPTQKPIHLVFAEVELKVGQSARQSLTESKRGIRFESADGLHVFQAQAEGFTLSRLRPYDSWESLFAEAQATWNEYVAVSRPESIIRVATRFINRLELPMPVNEFEKYLTIPPVVPKGLPELVSESFSRVVFHDEESGGAVIFSQAIEQPNPDAKALAVLIDIDVFRQQNFDVSSTQPWDLLNKFRELKNRTFFASITPKTLELVK